MGRPALTAEERASADRRARHQILAGLAGCLADHDYAATTIADIVRRARVSKTTFYAHFSDKEECFIRLYSGASNAVIAAMRRADRDATAAGLPWREHLTRIAASYLERLIEGGGVTRASFLDVPAVGPAAVAMRRDVQERYALLVREVSARLAADDDGLQALTPDLSRALVGGVNELVTKTIEQDRIGQLARVAAPATELWASLLTRA